MNFTPALFIAAALLTTGPALADKAKDGRDHDERRAAMFQNLDANDDGSISREEFANPHAKHFKAADTDKNGTISLAEFEAKFMERAKTHAKKIFERLDANSDGAIDKSESAAMRGHRFGGMRGHHSARMGRHGGGGHHFMHRKHFDHDGDPDRNHGASTR